MSRCYICDFSPRGPNHTHHYKSFNENNHLLWEKGKWICNQCKRDVYPVEQKIDTDVQEILENYYEQNSTIQATLSED